MPELPEVETRVRTLAPQLAGLRLESVEDLSRRQIVWWDGGNQEGGGVVTGVGRRGKFILLEFDNGWVHAVHLRMTGNLYVGARSDVSQYTRCLWHFESGHLLLFDDVRRFGRVYAGQGLSPNVQALGPEPLASDLTPARLRQMLAGRKRRLKSLLLDQTFIAGIGNIYADEILHRSGLHPETPAHRVSRKKAGVMHQVMVEVLSTAIENKGTSFDWAYAGGNMQNHLHVYGRAGEGCLACGTILRSMRVGNRGTTFCPVCQRVRH